MAMQESDLEREEGEGYEEVHVYAERGAEVAVHREPEQNEDTSTTSGAKVNLCKSQY